MRSRTSKTLILSCGRVVASFSALLISMVLVRLFSKEDWATYRQTLLAVTIAAPLLGMGLSQALMYFLPTQIERGRGVILESAIPLLITGAAFVLFIFSGGNTLIAQAFNNPALKTTLLIVAPVIIFQLVGACVTPAMIASGRVATGALFGVGTNLFATATVLTCVLVSRSVSAALIGQVVGAVGAGVATFYLLSSFQPSWPQLTHIWEHLSFGIPLGMTTLVGIFSKNVDRLMVSSYSGLEEYAIFDNGAIELPLIGVITGSMTSILMVDYRVMVTEGKTKEILELLHRSIIKSATILIPTMFLLLCLAPELMVLMFGEPYRDSSSVFRVYLLLLPVRTLVFGSIALAAGRTKSLAIVSVLTITANVILNYFAIKTFGYIGCAFATVFVIYCVSAFGRATISKQVLGCSLRDFIPWQELSGLFLIGTLATPLLIGLQLVMQGVNPILTLVFGVTIYCSLTLPCLIRWGYINPSTISNAPTQIIQKLRK